MKPHGSTSAVCDSQRDVWGRGGGGSVSGGGSGGMGVGGGHGRPVRLLSELLGHCAAHPAYRIMSLRSLPQVRMRWGRMELGGSA